MRGDGNTQNVECTNVGFVCANTASGNDNTQTNNCFSIGLDCVNGATGDGNNQNLLCARMATICINEAGSFEPSSSNTQSTTCANADTCSNRGINTNVVANGADCESHDPDTTTYCQPGRTRILPNP